MAAMCDEELKRTVVQQLECVRCKATCRAPIYVCSGGHVVCGACVILFDRCPACHLHGQPSIRCPALEKISEKLKLPCENAPHGCTAMLNMADMAKHWESCKDVYKYRCAIGYPCPWRGKCPQDVIRHVTTKHPGHYLRGESVQINVYVYQAVTQHNAILVCAFEELFWVFCDYRADQTCWLFSRWFAHIGGEDRLDRRFQCKFTYFSDDGAIRHESTVPTWGTNGSRNNCLKLDEVQLQGIFSGGKASFIAEILKP